MHDFILQHSQQQVSSIPSKIDNPYESLLRKNGWEPEEDADDEMTI